MPYEGHRNGDWLSLSVGRERPSNCARSLGDTRLKSGLFFQLRSTEIWLLTQQLTYTLIIIAKCPRHRRGDEESSCRIWIFSAIRISCICGFAALKPSHARP